MTTLTLIFLLTMNAHQNSDSTGGMSIILPKCYRQIPDLIRCNKRDITERLSITFTKSVKIAFFNLSHSFEKLFDISN